MSTKPKEEFSRAHNNAQMFLFSTNERVEEKTKETFCQTVAVRFGYKSVFALKTDALKEEKLKKLFCYPYKFLRDKCQKVVIFVSVLKQIQ